MSDDYSDPAGESEMRRRAAWLLAALALVAVLVVALMVTFLSNHNKHPSAGPSVISGYPTNPTSSSPHPTQTQQSTSTGPTSPTTSPGDTSSTGVSEPPKSHHKQVSCPTSAPCIAQGDIGNAVAAINDYRESHGAKAIDGKVSKAAQDCALSNGTNCTGAWAETQLSSASGKAAIALLDPQYVQFEKSTFTSMEVGWAYDPASKQYYFAFIGDE